MLIINVIGGLGNQLFQYALYYYLDINNYNVKLDDSYFDSYKLHNGFELTNAFKVQPRMAKRSEVEKFKHGFKRSNNIFVLFEKLLFNKFDVQNTNNKSVKWEYRKSKKNLALFNLTDAYLVGYWNKEDYLLEIRETLINNLQFRVRYPLDTINSNVLSLLNQENTIAMHVRGGDFRVSARLNEDYYIKAIEKISKRIEIKLILIFTNDEKFTRELLSDFSYTIVDNNKGDSSFMDMYLMSQAKHFVIANSTFSWWAAYLNKNANTVVYPSVYNKISSFDNWIEV